MQMDITPANTNDNAQPQAGNEPLSNNPAGPASIDKGNPDINIIEKPDIVTPEIEKPDVHEMPATNKPEVEDTGIEEVPDTNIEEVPDTDKIRISR